MKHNNHPAHLKPWSRRTFLSNGALGISGLGLASALGFEPAIAQVSGFPNRAVQLVVPFPPGGVVDQTGRAIAQSLFKTWKQPVVINTKPGAGGAIGMSTLANAPADGYTVLVTSLSNHVLAPIIQRSQNFDSQKQLKPIGVALTTMGLMLVSKATEANNLKAFVELAKKTPGKLRGRMTFVKTRQGLAPKLVAAFTTEGSMVCNDVVIDKTNDEWHSSNFFFQLRKLC